MTTDDDILRALNGAPSDEDQEHLDAISEAVGHKPERRPKEGELPVQERGEDFEAVSIWAAKEAASVATRELAESIMRVDGGKNIYAAESEARQIAFEAYENAAKTSAYEDARYREVERITRAMAKRVRPRTVEAKRPAAAPVKTSEATAITSGRRHVQINELGRTGRITKL